MNKKEKIKKVISQTGIIIENIPEMVVMAGLAIEERNAGRTQISRIKIENGVAIGSNGKMAIKYKSELFSMEYSGLYDVETSKGKVILFKSEATDFPNFECLNTDELINKEPKCEVFITRDKLKNEQEIIRFMIKSGTAISRKYTDLIVSGSYRVYNEKNDEMVVFHTRQPSFETIYIIMPMVV